MTDSGSRAGLNAPWGRRSAGCARPQCSDGPVSQPLFRAWHASKRTLSKCRALCHTVFADWSRRYGWCRAARVRLAFAHSAGVARATAGIGAAFASVLHCFRRRCEWLCGCPGVVARDPHLQHAMQPATHNACFPKRRVYVMSLFAARAQRQVPSHQAVESAAQDRIAVLTADPVTLHTILLSCFGWCMATQLESAEYPCAVGCYGAQDERAQFVRVPFCRCCQTPGPPILHGWPRFGNSALLGAPETANGPLPVGDIVAAAVPA